MNYFNSSIKNLVFLTGVWSVGPNDDDPWIEVDLGATFEIKWVATQGMIYIRYFMFMWFIY